MTLRPPIPDRPTSIRVGNAVKIGTEESDYFHEKDYVIEIVNEFWILLVYRHSGHFAWTTVNNLVYTWPGNDGMTTNYRGESNEKAVKSETCEPTEARASAPTDGGSGNKKVITKKANGTKKTINF